MKLFALSLEEEAIGWLTSLLDNSISTSAQCENAFFEKWGEHQDNRYMLASLSSSKLVRLLWRTRYAICAQIFRIP